MSELNFGINENEKTLKLENNGVGSIDYTIEANADWITLSQTSGTISKEIKNITVTVNRQGLSYGTYEKDITINSSGGNIIIKVIVVIPNPNAPFLVLSDYSLNYGETEGEKVLKISNEGKGDLNWSLSKTESWISLEKESGVTTKTTPSNVKISVNRTGLTPGDYETQLVLTSNGGDANITVKAKVSSTVVLSVDKSELDFGLTTSVLSFDVTNSGNGDLDWSVVDNKEWLTVTPATGTNAGTVNVFVDRTNVDYGNYSGQIDITSNGGNKVIIVKMEKSQANSAPSVSFDITPGKGDLDTNFELDASGSVDDNDPLATLLIRVRWENGGSFSEWSTTKKVNHQYGTYGTKTVTVEVKDTKGLSSSANKTIDIIENKAPTARFTVNPETGMAGFEEFTVNASTSTDDQTLKSNLEVRWKFDENSSFTEWSNSKTETKVYDIVGTKTITLQVKDEKGLIGEITKEVTATEPETPVAGLIAYYSFDDGTAKDMTGHGYNGVIGNRITVSTDTPNNEGKSMGFTGQDGIKISNNVLSGKDQISISIWMKTSFTVGAFITYPATNYSNRIGVNGLELYFNNTFKHTIPNNYGGFIWKELAVDTIYENKWHMLTFVSVKNDKIKLYVDGKLKSIGNETITNTFGKSDLFLGKTALTANENYTGKFDNFRIYSRALSNNEINLIYQTEK